MLKKPQSKKITVSETFCAEIADENTDDRNTAPAKATWFWWLFVAAVSSHYVLLLFWSGRGVSGPFFFLAAAAAGWIRYFAAPVQIRCQDNNGHQQRWVINHQLVWPRRTKPRRLFQRRRVDTSPQEVAAPSKGEVNFGFNPLHSASHGQSNGSPAPPSTLHPTTRMLLSEGAHCVQLSHSTLSLPGRPTQPNPPPQNHKGWGGAAVISGCPERSVSRTKAAGSDPLRG